MKQVLPLLAALAILLLLAPIAWAADGVTDPNALTRMTEIVFEILVVVLPVLVVWLVHRLIAAYEKRTGTDVPEAIEARLDAWIEQGIHYAAEKSYKKVKAKAAKLTGPEKLEEAADFVFDLAQSRGWVDWTKDKIKAKLEAKLGTHRANGGVPKLDQ